MDFLDTFKYPLLLGGGVLAGIINTLAGNGSAITLSLLMLFGLPSNIANATNRVGVFFQATTALVSLKKTEETSYLFKKSLWIVFPALIGSIVGALLAVDINEEVLRIFIGVLMLLLFTIMLVKGKAIRLNYSERVAKPSFLNGSFFFAAGLYAGFIQMGVGVIMLSVMTLLMNYGLQRANLVKQLLIFLFVTFPFIIFILSGMVVWSIGLILAVGQMLGAWVAARYLLQNERAQIWIQRLLLVILFISGVSLLDVIEIFLK